MFPRVILLQLLKCFTVLRYVKPMPTSFSFNRLWELGKNQKNPVMLIYLLAWLSRQSKSMQLSYISVWSYIQWRGNYHWSTFSTIVKGEGGVAALSNIPNQLCESSNKFISKLQTSFTCNSLFERLSGYSNDNPSQLPHPR